MPTVPSPQTVLDRVRRDVERNALRARNGSAGAGIDRPQRRADPEGRRVAARPHVSCGTTATTNVRVVGPPLLIVFSLISRSYILDLSRATASSSSCSQAGFDVYLLDWGVPDERDAANRLEDYVDDYIPPGSTGCCELSGADEVNLFGYCFGGDLRCCTPRTTPTRRCAA